MFRHFTLVIFRLRNEKLSKKLYLTYVGCIHWGGRRWGGYEISYVLWLWNIWWTGHMESVGMVVIVFNIVVVVSSTKGASVISKHGCDCGVELDLIRLVQDQLHWRALVTRNWTFEFSNGYLKHLTSARITEKSRTPTRPKLICNESENDCSTFDRVSDSLCHVRWYTVMKLSIVRLRHRSNVHDAQHHVTNCPGGCVILAESFGTVNNSCLILSHVLPSNKTNF